MCRNSETSNRLTRRQCTRRPRRAPAEPAVTVLRRHGRRVPLGRRLRRDRAAEEGLEREPGGVVLQRAEAERRAAAVVRPHRRGEVEAARAGSAGGARGGGLSCRGSARRARSGRPRRATPTARRAPRSGRSRRAAPSRRPAPCRSRRPATPGRADHARSSSGRSSRRSSSSSRPRRHHITTHRRRRRSAASSSSIARATPSRPFVSVVRSATARTDGGGVAHRDRRSRPARSMPTSFSSSPIAATAASGIPSCGEPASARRAPCRRRRR